MMTARILRINSKLFYSSVRIKLSLKLFNVTLNKNSSFLIYLQQKLNNILKTLQATWIKRLHQNGTLSCVNNKTDRSVYPR